MKCPVSSGMRGWLVTGLVILGIDIFSEKTLSESFSDFSRTRTGRYVTIAGWTFLTAHLFGAIPAERDPIVLAFARLPRRKKVAIVRVL